MSAGPGVPPAGPPRPGAHNDLTDVAGVLVGHHQRRGRGWLTGTTVVVCPDRAVGAVDVRGGGPATRETDALAPTALVDRVHAVCLSGGSAYGLAAADGVMAWLAARSTGFPVGPAPHQVVPIVPAACLFDLYVPARFGRRPDATFGARAAAAASDRTVAQGSVGAATGARADGGTLRGGLGSASAVLPDGTTVAALVAANPAGGVVDPRTGLPLGASVGLGGEFGCLRAPRRSELRGGSVTGDEGALRHTVLAVVATDTELTKAEANRLAVAGHDGMARAVSPAHGMTDGDVVFALSTGARPLQGPGVGFAGSRPARLNVLMALAADAVSRALVHGILAATGADGVPAYFERYPSALVPGSAVPGRRAARLSAPTPPG